MNAREVLSRILTVVGGIAMLVGAIDPIDGSALILPGSGLFALSTYVGQAERRLVVYRACVSMLIAIGVGALWGFSWVGGFGGTSEYLAWWGILVMPYPIGWWWDICGPGSPRWLVRHRRRPVVSGFVIARFDGR